MLTALLKLLPFVGTIFDRALESRDKAEDNLSQEQSELRKAVAAEFSKQSTNWWDSFVDGINRLIRPTTTLGVIALFVWAAIDPITFSATMTALSLVPSELWAILGTIIVFWFGGRTLENLKGTSPVDPNKVANVIETIRKLDREAQTQVIKPVAYDTTPAQNADMSRLSTEKPQSGKTITSEQYTSEMSDTAKPLSLPAIEEWNRRRQNKT